MSVAGSSQPGFRITDSPGMIHAYFVLVPSSGFEYFSQTIIHGLSHTLSPSPVARVCYTDTPWDIALLCLPVEPVFLATFLGSQSHFFSSGVPRAAAAGGYAPQAKFLGEVT